MLESVSSALTSMIGWVGDVVTALVTTEGALQPLLGLFCIGVAGTAVMFGIKIIRGLTWGA